MKDFTKKLKCNDPASKILAIKLLVDAGIITKKGNIRKPYRDEYNYKLTNRKNSKNKENRK